MINQLFRTIADSNNIKKRELYVNKINCTILFHKNLSNIADFNNYYIERFTSSNIENLDSIFPGVCEKEPDIDINNLVKNIFSGFIYLYIESSDQLFKFLLPKLPERSISENNYDPMNITGSRDALVESLNKNVGLIEKRLKSNKLRTESLQIGTISQTEINVLFLENNLSNSEINQIIVMLKEINIEAVKSIGDISRIFTKGSLFPLTYTTSSPETIANNILNGRFAILVDNCPVALVLPGTFELFTSMPDEAAAPNYYLFYMRIINAILIFISIFFLGIYTAMINHHSNCLSMLLISEIKVSNRGSTLPLIGEILFITLIFEFLTIAASRNSAGYLQNVIITVGGLLIGQNIVSSGFISPFNLVITALCFLSTYGISNNKYLIISFSYLRLLILIGGLLLGMLGVLITSIIAILYLYNLKSLKTPYLGIFSIASLKNMFSSKFKRKTKIS